MAGAGAWILRLRCQHWVQCRSNGQPPSQLTRHPKVSFSPMQIDYDHALTAKVFSRWAVPSLPNKNLLGMQEPVRSKHPDSGVAGDGDASLQLMWGLWQACTRCPLPLTTTRFMVLSYETRGCGWLRYRTTAGVHACLLPKLQGHSARSICQQQLPLAPFNCCPRTFRLLYTPSACGLFAEALSCFGTFLHGHGPVFAVMGPLPG